MDPLLSYFLKVNAALILFYGFYRLFFHKDTFLRLRRFSLMAFYAVALIYPFCNLQTYMAAKQPITEAVHYYSSLLSEIQIEPVTNSGYSLGYSGIFWGLYLIIFIFLLIRFGSQLVSILTIKSRKEVYNGIPIRVPFKEQTPFSFFHRIYITPSMHTEKELNEILIHEQTHARQWHSIDVIVSDLFARLCWINPFAWLMKREIRHNLEYLADRSVVQSGNDTKTYQYHLLGLANSKAAAQLSNNFNVSPLKRRIKMMNKKPSNEVGRLKYVLFVPLIGLLLLISNIEALARVFNENIVQPEIALEATNESSILFIEEPTEAPELQTPQKKTQEALRVAEAMPQFPGGDAALMKFLAGNIKYPTEAAKAKIQGRVVIQFVVNEKGEITNPSVVQSVNPQLDEEALRVVNIMPLWEPGKNKEGEAVAVFYVLPVNFRIDREAEKPVKKELSATPNESMPKFPGGEAAMMKFLNDNVKYPAEAVKSNIQGRVIVQFTISETGKITNTKVMSGVNEALNKEALRVINAMPQWEPGKKDGTPVPVQFVLPVDFKIPKDKQGNKEGITVTTYN